MGGAPHVLEAATTPLAAPKPSTIASQVPSDAKLGRHSSDGSRQTSAPIPAGGPTGEISSVVRATANATLTPAVAGGGTTSNTIAPSNEASSVGMVSIERTSILPVPPFNIFNSSSSGFTTLVRATTVNSTTATAITDSRGISSHSSQTLRVSSSASTVSIQTTSTSLTAPLTNSSSGIASTTPMPPGAALSRPTTQNATVLTSTTDSSGVSTQSTISPSSSSVASTSSSGSTSNSGSTSSSVSTRSLQTPSTSPTAPFTYLNTSSSDIASTTVMPPGATSSTLTTLSNATTTTNTDSGGTSSHPTSSYTTTTTTTTTTEQQTPTGACFFPSSACPPSGLTIKLYANSAYPSDGYGVSDGVSGVGASYYLPQSSLAEGQSDSLSVPYKDSKGATVPSYPQPKGINPYFRYFPGLTQTYGGITYNANNFTLVFTGYFVPTQTGTHTFCARYVDNRDTFYLGSDNAFPCGSASNGAVNPAAKPLLDRWFGSKSSIPCGSEHLVAGFYYPIRSVFGNWGTASQLNFTVTTPDGVEREDVGAMLHPDSCS